MLVTLLRSYDLRYDALQELLPQGLAALRSHQVCVVALWACQGRDCARPSGTQAPLLLLLVVCRLAKWLRLWC